MSREVMQQALEALENSVDLVIEDAHNAEQLYGKYPSRQARVGGLKLLADEHQKAITALRAALKEPEQEPVAIKHMMRWVDALKRMSDNGQHMKIPGMNAGACWELAIELEQFLYTHPPQRKPLTNEEIVQISIDTPVNLYAFVRAIEQAHGIKQEDTE